MSKMTLQNNKHECSKCKKQFKNSDYLEYHMKIKHRKEGICLADHCDVFECPEQPEKTLRHQVFMNRDHNYEGRSSSQ